MKKSTDIETIINGHDYFYCERAKCRLRLYVCIKRQVTNVEITEYLSESCNGCPRIRNKCRLNLPVCLKSPKSSKSSNGNMRAYLICKKCPQGKQNRIKEAEHTHNKQITSARMAHNPLENEDTPKDKGINIKMPLWPNIEACNDYIQTTSS